MLTMTDGSIRHIVERVYREDSRRVLATVIRLFGDFNFAEDAFHDALRAALGRWPRDGVPANPRAWLISTGRSKVIYQLGHAARSEPILEHLAEQLVAEASSDDRLGQEGLEDDGLYLIFTFCHPARQVTYLLVFGRGSVG